MTKEQILAAIAQAAAGGLVFDTEAAIISKVKEMNAGGFVTFWVGTRAQYNALPSHDTNCAYIITDDTWQKEMENMFKAHVEVIGNPHGVTIDMIGAASAADLKKHKDDTANPHGVTYQQTGAAPAYSYGTDDLEAGVTPLEKGKLHFVYVKG
jgi:hypothetical protein